MKYFRNFILTLSFFLFINAGLTATPDVEDPKNLKQKIMNRMSFPEGANEGVVHAVFSVEKNGKIAVYVVESNDPYLKEHVLNKLRKIDLKGNWLNEEIINMNFVFKKES